MNPGPVIFDLCLSREASGLGIEARCDGVDLPGTFGSPNATELERLARQARSVSRSHMERPEQAKLGVDLFRALFRGRLLRHWDRVRGRALGLEVPFLVRVHLPMDEDLHLIPWEWLHDGWDFLAKNSRYGALVRCVESHRELRPSRVDPPIRLLVTRGPGKVGEPAVEWGAARSELVDLQDRRPDCLELTLIEEPVSVHELEAQFGTRPGPHIWHHVGHGGFLPSSPDVFRLLLASGSAGEGQWVRGDRLAELTHLCPSLRMIVLATCHSGDFSGLAPRLARLDIPCVVGFPWAAGMLMAQRMTTALYSSLLDYPPELALSFARHSVAGRGEPTLEWAQAILYARRRDFEPLAQQESAARPRPEGTRSESLRQGGMKIRNISAGRDAKVIGSTEMDVAGVWAGQDVIIRGLSEARRHSEQLSRDLDRLDRRGLWIA